MKTKLETRRYRAAERFDTEMGIIRQQWIAVLMRGGGFRPCHVIELQRRNGCERSPKIVAEREAYESYNIAEGEAMEWADRIQIPFRRWP